MPTIRHRRASKAQWEALNPVLASGEIGYEMGTNKLKVGDGLTAWKDLTYFIDETFVRSLIGSGGGGGGASIDDNAIATTTSWSSKKTSDELAGKANDLFVIMDPLTGEFVNVVTGEVVDIPLPGTPGHEDLDFYSLQLGLAMAYDMAVNARPKYVETHNLVPGPISIGPAPKIHAFWGNPALASSSVNMNSCEFLSIFLTKPSTSGPIRFRVIGPGSYDPTVFEIPEGVTEVFYDIDVIPRNERPTYSAYTQNQYVTVEILEAGVGAEDFIVRAARLD
ncbi:hyaluronidase [Rhodococcus phage ReqiPoco6]|uniref:Tail fiber protein n=1 Tax=Rhodococcus phage ReqiPoco6 TaxID=691964 RepID=D4P7M6_9CAUD|nr:hyaluronidase [Rhodococcus phage ReqiPoco6]ADD81006.1 tail fiber protein [Rhodococcus phage ReqiPoco6]